MSRIRRIGFAAAAAATLALAIPAGSSAITISSTGATERYNVAGSLTMYTLSDRGSGGNEVVGCWENGRDYLEYGSGFITGTASTPFRPRSLEYSSLGMPGTCVLHGKTGNVDAAINGALMVTLTNLAPGENPLATRRAYEGTLWLHSYSKISFKLEEYANCTVTVAGPQSVEMNYDGSWTGRITVDDVKDEIDVVMLAADFASTKTAGCPSTIGNTVTISHPYYPFGWRLKGVTVTP